MKYTWRKIGNIHKTAMNYINMNVSETNESRHNIANAVNGHNIQSSSKTFFCQDIILTVTEVGGDNKD